MHALMNIVVQETVVQGHVVYRSIDDVLSITSHTSNTTRTKEILHANKLNRIKFAAKTTVLSEKKGKTRNLICSKHGKLLNLFFRLLVRNHPHQKKLSRPTMIKYSQIH